MGWVVAGLTVGGVVGRSLIRVNGVGVSGTCALDGPEPSTPYDAELGVIMCLRGLSMFMLSLILGVCLALELLNDSFGRLLCLVNGWMALHVSACQGGFPTVSVAIEVHFFGI